MNWPFVSRVRYERELRQLKEAYSISADELRARLQSLIDKITLIKFDRYEGQRYIIVKVLISDREPVYFSPFEADEYWYYLGKKISESLKAESFLQRTLK